MNTPLYQGPQHSTARATQASVSPQHPFAKNFLQSAAAQTQQALDLETAIQQRQEYTLEQNRAAALQSAQQALDSEMLQRLSLADGAEDSFYDENGILKKDEIDSLRSRYLSIADAWTSGFTSEQGLASATKAQQQYRSSVTNSINSKLLAGLGNRARRALQNNIQAHIARGDYDTPIKLAQQSNQDGYTSDADLTLIENDINTARWQNEIDAAPNADTLLSAKRQLESTPFFQTPNGKSLANKMLKKIDSLLTYQGKPRSVEEESIISTTAPSQKEQASTGNTTSAAGSTSKSKITPAQAPPAAPGYIQLHYATFGDNLKDIDAQKAAYKLLFKDAFSRTTLDDEATVELQLLGKSLELPASAISSIIQQRQDSLNAKLPPFDATKAITALKNNHKAGTARRNAQLKQTDADNAAHWAAVYTLHDNITNSVLEQTEDDYYAWLPSNLEKNGVEQARAFQQMLTKRMQEQQTLAQAPSHSWGYLNLNTYFDRYAAAEHNAAKAAILDANRAKLFKKQLDADQKEYERIKNSPSYIRDFYRGDIFGAIARKNVSEALAYQAQHVRIDSPMDNPAKAAALPDTNSQLIIYTNPDPEKTSAISRQDSILVQQGGDTFRVKIVESPHVSAPVPSILLQQKLKLLGRKPNHFYFQNNILTFTQKKKTKSPTYQNTNTIQEYPAAYTDDGLVPLDEYAAAEQEGIFPGTTISAEYDLPTSDLPF